MRQYHRYFTVSPQEDLIITRLRYACTLLAQSELNIEQVAEQCGYNAFSYFFRLFHQRFDMTPMQYRKLHRPNSEQST